MRPAFQVYDQPPIPPVEEDTRWFDAGALTFGVEYRLFNEQIVRDAYRGEIASQNLTEDSGISIHVSGASDREEYLRFDCFEHEPHYHYIVPAKGCQVRIPYDDTANGPMLDWALDKLRHRLAPMLREAGMGNLADACDDVVVAKALDEVEALARSVGG
jgi:hypothetical protein